MNEIRNAINEAYKKNTREILIKIRKDFTKYIESKNKSFFKTPEIEDLRYLFDLYDSRYFSGHLSKHFDVKFSFSVKISRAPGILRYGNGRSEIMFLFSTPMIFEAYDEKASNYTIRGVTYKDPSEVVMSILEHEIAHIVEYVMHGATNCTKEKYRKIAFDLFGHIDSEEVIKADLRKKQLSQSFKIGDEVIFPYFTKTFRGTITNIRTKVTVEVSSVYSTKKYYVSFDVLKPVEKDS